MSLVLAIYAVIQNSQGLLFSKNSRTECYLLSSDMQKEQPQSKIKLINSKTFKPSKYLELRH